MEIINKIAKIREKLDLYGKPYITEELLQKLLDKFAPNYSITNLCNIWLITPIKRWKVYINIKYKAFVNSFIVGDLYMWDDLYVFWWLWIYNRYSLTEQVAEWQTIYNTKISWKKIIWTSKFIFVRQRESFFYWWKKEKIGEYSYNIMTIERAFIQMIKEWKEFNNLPYWIDKDKLLKLALMFATKPIISKIEKLCI